jgi:hypothetical protein
MSIMLRITDKDLGAAEIAAPDLLLPLMTVSAREILRLRVEAEVTTMRLAAQPMC